MSPMDIILIESTYFENYKSKGYDDFITALKIADDKIIDYIEKTKGVWTKAKQNELRKYINDEIITSYGGLFETIPNEAVESATIAYGAMIGSIKPELPKEAIKAIINPKREIQGRTLTDLFKLDGENHARKLSIEVASSVARGIPVDKLMRELDMTVSKRELGQVDNKIIATKKLIKNATDETKIKDLNSDLDNLQYQRNVLAVDNRYKQYAKQNIRTLISESRADGRYVAFRDMEEIGTVKGYEYISVLDFKTTKYCQDMDSTISYKSIDEIKHLVKTHHQCRADWIFFTGSQRSATRASVLGQTANVSYKEWFKAIPDDVKQRVLTKKQYSLWKKNQYPVNSLADITRTQTMNTISDNMNNLIED